MRATISFDLDGVLIQNPFARGVLPHVRRHLRGGSAFDGVDADEADRRIRAAVIDEVRGRMARGDLAAAYDWDAIYALLAERFGAPPVPDVAELVEHYCTVPDTIWLLDGASEALTRLAESGYRLVATTNGFRSYQEPVLRALGIDGFFDALYAPDTTGFAKPDPRILAGVEGLVAHVGDTLHHDVYLARRLGIVGVWIHEGLPDAVRALPAAARADSAEFAAWFAGAVAELPYGEAHPEAGAAELRPDHVLLGVHELGEVALPELARS